MMRRSTSATLAPLVAVLFGIVAALGVARTAQAEPRTGTQAAGQNSGAVSGTIRFEGTPPRRATIHMESDPVCAAEHTQPVLTQDGKVNANGTLPNVFVYIQGVSGSFTPPSKPAVIDQTGCMYKPHVLGVMAGQKLRIISSDPTTHNIHFLSKINKPWNQTQLPGSPPLVHKFARPEIMIPVHCNHHPWMSAYVGVTSNPFFAVTGSDGTFAIKGLPPGEYTLHAWTAAFGMQEQKITVRDGQSTMANFTFK